MIMKIQCKSKSRLAIDSSKPCFEFVDKTDQVSLKHCFEIVDRTDQVSSKHYLEFADKTDQVSNIYLGQGDADLV